MKQHNAGFGLTGALVGLTVSAIGIAAVSSFMSNSLKVQKSVEGSVAFDTLVSSIKLVLSNPDLCVEALQDFRIGTVATSPIQPVSQTFSPGAVSIYLGSSPIAFVNQDLGAGLVVSELSLPSVNQRSLGGGRTHHVLKVNIVAKSKTQRYGSQTLSPRAPMLVEAVTNAAGVVTSCGAQVSQSIGIQQAPAWSVYGENRRCRGDKIAISCGANVNNTWNYNYCTNNRTAGVGWPYNYEQRWDSEGGGYVSVQMPCPAGQICSYAWLAKFKTDNLCIDGFEGDPSNPASPAAPTPGPAPASPSPPVPAPSPFGSQLRTCTNEQSDETSPNKLPVCVEAASNAGGGSGRARIISCPDNRPGYSGVIGLHLVYFGGQWQFYNAAGVLNPCTDGTALVASW
jgi:hypothetical protein